MTTPISPTTQAIALAEQLLLAAKREQTAAEAKEARQMARMMHDAPGKAFTFAMVDQTFRSHRAGIRAKRWRGLLRDFGVPQYLSSVDRGLMKVGAMGSAVLPGTVMKAVAQRMRQDCERVILAGEREPLHAYLVKRKHDGFSVNLNHLGEAVLSEAEAGRRLHTVLEHLRDPEVSYISVKISAIFSQINLVAYAETLSQIKDRLRVLYREAAKLGKFVNLDMEEYRDLALTLEAFTEVLGEAEFKGLSAGIVLQAYLPDSWVAQQQLTRWAHSRVAHGGADIKVRLVKGANLAMESVEAELHGWNAAPYASKPETDANFRRMLEYGCQRENASAVRLGVASHNLFDVALALTLRERHGVVDRVEIEMLEGMANHQARAVQAAAKGLLLYAPAVQEHDFLSALAYLMRRLDENTAEGNFLQAMFDMEPGSETWEAQKQAFETGWRNRNLVSAVSHRSSLPERPKHAFSNEPDTDWAKSIDRKSLAEAIANYKPTVWPELPSVAELMETAELAQARWAGTSLAERAACLLHAAEVMASQRFQTLASLRLDGKKAVADGDAEVSEAIDFARYYAGTAALPEGVQATPVGVTVIASPWNFCYAIPCGGILAALVAGNAVLFKPAPQTQHTAWLLVQQLWQAGIPRDVLQFFPCTDGTEGKALMTHPAVGCVVLTGAWETARMFQEWRPDMRLLAETSGKNSLIITAQADRELAIKDLIRSAFGHSGQKCSAASLAIVEAEVYDDPDFQRQLKEAAMGLPVGPATDLKAVVTPLILEPSPHLHRALTQLEPGETWLLKPQVSPEDPCLWSPGIRLGVNAGSWFHCTECFGPVLGLMRAESLFQAIAWQNAVQYGLTAGIHSLDAAEIALWQEKVQAGNLYINRPITGAIVQRQPFGGWKRSCIGPGAKAGGPNYVWSFATLADAASSANGDFVESFREAWEMHFSKAHDATQLRSEQNEFRYRPARGVILRLPQADTGVMQRAKLAAELTGTPLVISLATDENDAAFAARLPKLAKQAEFLRTPAGCSNEVLAAAHAAELNWVPAPVTSHGRLELRHWVREQSVSRTLHRYGQISSWKPSLPAKTTR